MINSLLVAASLNVIESILTDNEIPYEIFEDDAYKGYKEFWANADDDQKSLGLRQARPAIDRIFRKEPFVFKNEGGPLVIKFNDETRKMKDSFGELLLEREALKWRIAFSIKNDARIIASTAVADRDTAEYQDHTVNVYNEIDDFGDRIFGVPCSNEYFQDMNAILERISSHDKQSWAEKLTDDSYAYDNLIKPMLKAIGDEIIRICKDHPEAPERLIDFFYGKIDYYYLNPIAELELTRIGAINSHKGLGRIPNNSNHYTQPVAFPTKLLDVRFANGKYGELSKDTIQISFDGGWAICITVIRNQNHKHGRFFAIKAYLPVTPFGSYRDQVAWDPEA